MANIIVVVIVLAIVTAAIAKIIIEKRKGVKCIGCPYSKTGRSCSCKDSKKTSYD